MQKQILMAIIIVALASCKPKNDCEAGDGGSIILNVIPQHHGVTIPNQPNYPDSVYLIYNTKEAPSLNNNLVPMTYDKMVIGSGNEDHIHIKNMKCGDYYIYCTGYDTIGKYRVVGGLPFTTEKESGSIDVYVPVTE